MRLYLVQHGVATSEEENPERPLTNEGRMASEEMARWFASLGPSVTEIRHSGKTRAAETARIMAAGLASQVALFRKDGLGPADDPESLPGTLAGRGHVMIVGHLPYLSRLAGLLLSGSVSASPVRFSNSGVVCLEDEPEGWQLLWAVIPETVHKRIRREKE